MDQVRQRTKRKVPLTTQELIAELNPLLRGWGEYYKRTRTCSGDMYIRVPKTAPGELTESSTLAGCTAGRGPLASG